MRVQRRESKSRNPIAGKKCVLLIHEMPPVAETGHAVAGSIRAEEQGMTESILGEVRKFSGAFASAGCAGGGVDMSSPLALMEFPSSVDEFGDSTIEAERATQVTSTRAPATTGDSPQQGTKPGGEPPRNISSCIRPSPAQPAARAHSSMPYRKTGAQARARNATDWLLCSKTISVLPGLCLANQCGQSLEFLRRNF